MSDLINRQAAIDAVNCDILVTGKENAETVAKTIGLFVDRIKALPSADRPTGEWVDGKCNQCGGNAPFWPMASAYHKSKFCPDCGAMMKGVDDATN